MSDLFANSPEKIEGLVKAITPANANRGWQGIFKELGYPTQDEQPIPKSVLDDVLKTKADDLLADHPTQRGQKTAYTICDIRPSAAQIFQILYFKLRGSLRITQSIQRLFIERYSRTFGNFLFVLTSDDQEFSLCVGRAEKESQKPLIRFLKIGPKNLYRTGVEILSGMGLAGGAAPKAIADALWHALSVEKVTKEFYQFVEKHHTVLKTELDRFKRIKGFEEDRARVQFATRLLGRMVFLRFISKKGIVPEAVFQFPEGKKGNYYREMLAPLFFDVLNTPMDERKKGLPPELVTIPFLNGGLFEPHDQDGWPNPLYVLPNSWFSELADTFSRFNFTVAENTPWDQEVAVDPEMLGKIFENLLAAENTETGESARKEKGAFYTPREIVDYLCRESLRARLGTLHPTAKPEYWGWLLDDAEKPSTIPVTAAEVIASLDALKIIDPAVGSGAFPIGMMHVLTGAYQKLDDRYDAYRVKERIIKNNLYGADIEPIAIELAKLRCWLSLIVESDSRKVQPLPNLDLKFFCVNTLLDPPPLTENELLFAGEIKALEKLEQKFFEEHSSSKKVALRKQIGQALDDMYSEVRKQYVGKAIQAGGKTGAVKKIKTAINAASQYPDDPQLFSKWLETGSFPLPFFPKELLCPDVFGGADATKHLQPSVSSLQPHLGFDIVVANPPYVRQEDIGDTKPQLVEKYDCATGMADLYVYFYERGWQLLKAGGALAFISSNKFFRSGYGEKLRGFLAGKSLLHQVIDFGDAPVFTAIAYPSIVILSKKAPNGAEPRVMTWEPGPRVEDFASIFPDHSFHIAQKELTPNGWRLESPMVLRLLEKLRKAGKPLGEYVKGRFYRGVLTGLNEAFVVDRPTRDRLIKEHKSSAEVLKPFLRGRDVKRWGVEFANQYLIKIESSENKKHPWSEKTGKEAEKAFAKSFPSVYVHFESLRKISVKKDDRGSKTLYDKLLNRDDHGKNFWELRSCAYWKEFEQSKIVYPDIYEHQSFAWDTSKVFLANTCYFIPSEEKWLCGLLNSVLIEWFYSKVSNKVLGGYLRAFSDYMTQIPIPVGDQQPIEKLIIKILSAKHADPSADVSALESEINEHVYRLYGLTKDEIKIIEENLVK